MKKKEISLEIINLDINMKILFLFVRWYVTDQNQMPFPQHVFSS